MENGKQLLNFHVNKNILILLTKMIEILAPIQINSRIRRCRNLYYKEFRVKIRRSFMIGMRINYLILIIIFTIFTQNKIC